MTLPSRVVGAALQLAAGILAAIVALDLLPQAAASIPSGTLLLAFVLGSAAFLLLDYASTRHAARRRKDAVQAGSAGLFVGIAGDFLIDAIVIGIATAISLTTGLRLAVGMAVGQVPLAFVVIAAAKGQGVPGARRRGILGLLFAVIIFGAVLGYLVLKDQPATVNLTLIAGAAGFLLTAVVQVMIPDAHDFLEGAGPTLTPIWFTIGLAGFAFLKFVVV